MSLTIPSDLRLDKAAFFRDLGYKPHPGQVQIHASTAPRRIVACGVRWGKTRSAAMEALAAALQPRERSVGWVVAPTYDLADRVFRELGILVAEHFRHRVINLREHDKHTPARSATEFPSSPTARSLAHARPAGVAWRWTAAPSRSSTTA